MREPSIQQLFPTPVYITELDRKFTVKENNWLGDGKKVSFTLDANKETLKGSLNFTDPNYDFLGNALTYSIGSVSNDKPVQGYENTLLNTMQAIIDLQYDYFMTGDETKIKPMILKLIKYSHTRFQTNLVV